MKEMGARPTLQMSHSSRSVRRAPVVRTIPQVCIGGYEGY